jgi:hypothetical protein
MQVHITLIAKPYITRQKIRRELSVREKLKRDIILAIYGMTTGFGVLPSFVYPWMAGGSLHDYLKREYSDLPARRKLDIVSSCFVLAAVLTANGWAAGAGRGWYQVSSVSPVAVHAKNSCAP